MAPTRTPQAAALFFLGLLLLAHVANAKTEVFDVTDFGAKKGNLKKDSNMALIRAFVKACNSAGKTTKVVVPKGKYLVGEVLFGGPCNCTPPLTVEIQGDLFAQPDPSNYMNQAWFLVENVEGILITGNGSLDGQASNDVWSLDTCSDHSDPAECESTLLSTFWIHGTNKSSVERLKLKNSQGYSVKITESHDFDVKHLQISVPKKSRSKDGVFIADSDNINVENCTIKTGASKCITMGKGATRVSSSDINCLDHY